MYPPSEGSFPSNTGKPELPGIVRPKIFSRRIDVGESFFFLSIKEMNWVPSLVIGMGNLFELVNSPALILMDFAQ